MRYTAARPAWVKFAECEDFVLVGKDVVATASGIHAFFLDRRTGEGRVERFDGGERGDGASCIAGHPVVPMFSVAERRLDPRISVFGYPGIRRISSCTDTEKTSAYLCCAFAGTDYLLGQTSYPRFRLVVWHWRTGELATAIDATVVDVDRHRIACSPDSPRLIAGFTPRGLHVHRLSVCSTIVQLSPLEVDRPTTRDLTSLSWSPEGARFFLCDVEGEIWCVEPETSERQRVLPSRATNPSRPARLVAFRDGVVVFDAVGKPSATMSYGRFYRKREEDWREVWTIGIPSHPDRAVALPRGEGIVLRGEDGDVFELTCPTRDQLPRVERLCSNGARYEALSARTLQGRYLVLLDTESRVLVLDSSTGSLVSSSSRANSHGDAILLESHPTRSVAAVGSATGNCSLIDLTDPYRPRFARCFHLQREPLDLLEFSNGGSILGVATRLPGRVFLIGDGLGRVVGLLEVDGRIADFLVYEERASTAKVLVLAGNAGSNAGTTILVYSCDTARTFGIRSGHRADRAIELVEPLEKLLHSGGRDRRVIGVPRSSRLLHRLEISTDFREILLAEVLPSVHQVRNIEASASPGHRRLTTHGYDGLIVLRDGQDPRRILAAFVAHHRKDGGVKAVTLVGETIISLGRNGDLVAGRLGFTEASEPETASAIDEETFGLARTPRTLRTDEDETENDDETTRDAATWMDGVLACRAKIELDLALPTRLSISRDLAVLRGRMRALLDANEKEPPNARLPISTFDLDASARRQRTESAATDRDRLARCLRESIARQDRAASYLRRRFWEPLIVRPRSIAFLLRESRITNYPLYAISEEKDRARAWKTFSLETRTLVRRSEERPDSPRSCNNVAKDWLDRQPRGGRGYVEALETNAVIEIAERDTKVRFNDLFEKARTERREETERRKERVARLRHCVSELWKVFGAKPNRDVSPVRRSETVVSNDEDVLAIVVPHSRSDSGSSTTTSSEGNSGNSGNGELGFHAAALEKMMDGVLEIGWEEKAKRPVPKPDCLTAKDPSEYTEEDIRDIREYETKLRESWEKRREYRDKLENEIARIRETLRRSAETFDEELQRLAWRKIRAERKILREKLTRVCSILDHRKILGARGETSRWFEREVLPATREARNLAEECATLEATTAELKGKHEGLCRRDKLLEGKFRSEFADLKQPMVEHLFRHYKRRPRVGLASCESVVYLTEVAKRVVDRGVDRDDVHRQVESEILPRDCLDFLRGMDGLDAMPDGLPPQIETSHWRAMCKLRRIKVETETKLACCAVELVEAERTLSFYQRRALIARGRAARCRETLRDLERSVVELTEDAEVALVLKTGQLEIELHGRSEDSANALLVRREELLRVNRAIVLAGARKLTALGASVRLRKRISMEEWRHACTKMTMEDLRAHLDDLRSVKVTRVLRETSSGAYHPIDAIPESRQRNAERVLRAVWTRMGETAREEKSRLKKLMSETKEWRGKNHGLTDRVGRLESEKERRAAAAARDPSRPRDAAFRKKKMTVVTRRSRLAAQIRVNFEDLLALKSRLEIFKLKTYPTLRFER